MLTEVNLEQRIGSIDPADPSKGFLINMTNRRSLGQFGVISFDSFVIKSEIALSGGGLSYFIRNSLLREHRFLYLAGDLNRNEVVLVVPLLKVGNHARIVEFLNQPMGAIRSGGYVDVDYGAGLRRFYGYANTLSPKLALIGSNEYRQEVMKPFFDFPFTFF